MGCQSMSKKLDWHSLRIKGVSPLKNFRGTSRPMRSQHSELSTNRKARFWPENQCQQNLKSTNPMPICQFTYFPIHWKSSFISGSFNQPLASIEASDQLKQSDWTSPVSMQCQCIVTQNNRFNRPLASIETSDRLKGSRYEPMQCQCNVNTVSLRIILLISHLPL